MKHSYDIVIIGGGPAGITAGIYAAYDGNDVVIFEKNKLFWIPENHINLLNKVEGYPGFVNRANGTDMKTRFLDSLDQMDVPYEENIEVTSINALSDKNFEVRIKDGKNIIAKTVILATGTRPRNLLGANYNNVYYFAYENYKKYVGKNVVVVGCRNSGATAAIYLASHGLSVTMIEKQPKPPAKNKHISKLRELGVKILCNSTITNVVESKNIIDEVQVESAGKSKRLPVSALYYYVGVEPVNEPAKQLNIMLGSDGYILTDTECKTSIPGFFVAGDLCGGLKHIVKASGQGAQAAYSANSYLLRSG